MVERDYDGASWRISRIGACIAAALSALLLCQASAAADNRLTISDRYILDELRVSETLLKKAIERRRAGIIAFSASEKYLYTDLLEGIESGHGPRSRSCMRSLDAFGIVGHIAANILEPNQIAPLYPRDKELEGLDKEWDAYKAARGECESAVGAVPVDILPVLLSDAIKAAPPPAPRKETPKVDPSAFSERYPLDRLRELELRLRDAIIHKSGSLAASVSNQLFASDDLNWPSSSPPWPAACSPSPAAFAIASLLATGLLDPQRTSSNDPASTKVEMDGQWDAYRAGREACERSLGVSPVKILPDRLSEAF